MTFCPDVEDLLDDLGPMLLSKSGKVIVIPSEQMPTKQEQQLSAVFD